MLSVMNAVIANHLKSKLVAADSIAHSLMRNLKLGIMMYQRNVRVAVKVGYQNGD
jgi:hypothetical protein